MQRPIVVTGSIAIDRIMSFGGSYSDHLHPKKLDNVSVSIFLDSLTDAYGGVAANICHTLALLGEEPQLLGSVGADAVEYMEKLARSGVNITHIHESALPTASFNVITDGNQNQVGGFYPGAMFDSDSLVLAPWRNTDAVVVVSPHDPRTMRRQVQEASQYGLSLCYDVGQQVSNAPSEDLAAGVAAAKILILNDYELTVLADKTSRTVENIRESVPIVITTFGPNGSRIDGREIDGSKKVGIAEPDRVVDPTGAGDAYRAGFLYGYVRGWSLLTSAQLAATCASFAIESVGTQTHSPSAQEIAMRYQKSFQDKIILDNREERND